MNKTKLDATKVSKIVKSVPENLDEDHLAALVLTITDLQLRKETTAVNIQFLLQLFFTYARSIGLPAKNVTQLLRAAADRCDEIYDRSKMQ